MNPFRHATTVSTVLLRIVTAAMYLGALAGFVFNPYGPQIALWVSFYGGTLALMFVLVLITIMYGPSSVGHIFRDNSTTTVVMPYLLPGLVLIPESHIALVGWGVATLFVLVCTRSLFRFLADRRDDRLDDEGYQPSAWLDTPIGRAVEGQR